jgi:hypothetical protein
MVARMNLSNEEFLAWIILTTTYVVRGGIMAADDKDMASLTGLGKDWPRLRDKLIDMGYGRIDNTRWIDDDQDKNLECQRRASQRSTKANNKRWAKDGDE